jgi:hypothetical protein
MKLFLNLTSSCVGFISCDNTKKLNIINVVIPLQVAPIPKSLSLHLVFQLQQRKKMK